MTLIPLLLPHFRRIAKNIKFTPEDVTSIHPVLFYSVPEIPVAEGKKPIEEVYFYKPIGSFIYYIHLFSDNLPENVTIDSLKRDFVAEEIPTKLYRTHIELTGTLSK